MGRGRVAFVVGRRGAAIAEFRGDEEEIEAGEKEKKLERSPEITAC